MFRTAVDSRPAPSPTPAARGERTRSAATTAQLRRFNAVVVLVLGVLLATAWSVFGAVAPSAANVDAFSYDRWSVEYEIDVDENNRAVAHVTETLVPRFPEYDQNRGIVRGLPISYQGSSTDPRDFFVTDESGTPVPFEIEEEDGFKVLLIGDDSYVHGVQTYVIGYTLSDVILARDDGKADEFYWDLVDFEHAQEIRMAEATISFSPALAEKLTGAAACYYGPGESTLSCPITQNGSTFTAHQPSLGGYSGMTVAIGLEPGTVTQPAARIPSFALDVLPYGFGGLSILAGSIGAIAKSSQRRARRVDRKTIIAQYDVPDSLPPLIASPILNLSVNTVPAEIVHLAVNGAIRLEDGQPKQGFFGTKPAQPVLRLLDPFRAHDPVDRETLGALFSSMTPGEAVEIPRKSESFGKRMRALQASGVKQASSREYFEKVHSKPARIMGWIALGLLGLVAALLVVSAAVKGMPTPFAFVLAVPAILLAIISLTGHNVHTPLGAQTREYLLGVKEFIRVAEADRIAMLQSYSGAERRQDGTVDVIVLYERLLPYAMLFGMEKEWTKTLEVRYAESASHGPDWYPAYAAHSMGSFSNTMSQFTSSLTSSVSYTSSSSGGSGGGGFAGGGGGGGFSGGR